MAKKKSASARLVWDNKTEEQDLGKPNTYITWEKVFPRPIFTDVQAFFEPVAGIDESSDIMKNTFFYGDNLNLLKTMAINKQNIDLIYIDPPYMTNVAYHSNIEVGTQKDRQVVQREAFGDNWEKGIDSYLDMLYPRLQLMQQILSAKGSILVHLDWHISHYVRILLDEIFGQDNFINEIIWCYGGGSRPKKNFQRKHDIILWYARTKDYTFNPQYRPYTPGTLQRGLTKVKGENYKLHSEGALLQDWWTDINKILSPTAFENLKYPTQKPHDLLCRLITSASQPGDLVADFFAGSGTTAEVCNELGRNWILCDASPLARQTSHYRLIKSASSAFQISVAHNVELPTAGKLLLKSAFIQTLDDEHYLLNIGIESYTPQHFTDQMASQDTGAYIEFWEVDLNYNEKYFTSYLQIMRNGDRFKGKIPLDLITIIPKNQQHKIAIKVFDVFGNYALEMVNI